jgi:hypothetical protein
MNSPTKTPTHNYNNNMQTMKPTVLLRTVFGQKQGQTLTEFAAECKALRVACDAKGPDEYGTFMNAVAAHHGCLVDLA